MNGREPKICPFLTAGSLQIQNIVRVLNPAQPGTVEGQIQIAFAPCQREKCGLWVDNGPAANDGDCALKVLAIEASAVADK